MKVTYVSRLRIKIHDMVIGQRKVPNKRRRYTLHCTKHLEFSDSRPLAKTPGITNIHGDSRTAYLLKFNSVKMMCSTLKHLFVIASDIRFIYSNTTCRFTDGNIKGEREGSD